MVTLASANRKIRNLAAQGCKRCIGQLPSGMRCKQQTINSVPAVNTIQMRSTWAVISGNEGKDGFIQFEIYNYLSYSNKFRPQLVGKTHHRGSGSVSLAWPPACNLRSILRLPPKLRVREKSIRSRTLLRHIVAVHRRAQGRATRHPIKSSTSAESVQVNPSNTDCPGLMNTLLHLEESRVGLSKKWSESPETSTEMMAGPWCPCER